MKKTVKMKKIVKSTPPPDLDPEKAIHSKASWAGDLVYGLSERFGVPASFIIPQLLVGVGCTISRKVRFIIAGHQTNTFMCWSLSIGDRRKGPEEVSFIASMAASEAVGQPDNMNFFLNFDTSGEMLKAAAKNRSAEFIDGFTESWAETDGFFPVVSSGTPKQLGKLREGLLRGDVAPIRTNYILTEGHDPISRAGCLDGIGRNMLALREILDRNARIVRVLEAAKDANTAFQEHFEAHAAISDAIRNPCFRKWYASFPIKIARLAGLLTCLEYDMPTCISAEAVNSASYLFVTLAMHAKSFIEGQD